MQDLVIKNGHKECGVMDMYINLTVVTVSLAYTYIKTYIVHYKCNFFYLNYALTKL